MTVKVPRCCASILTSYSNLSCPNIISRPKLPLIGIFLLLCAATYAIFHNYGLLHNNEALQEILDHKLMASTTNKNTIETQEYAILIDAGSSGSRVFIYTWPPHNGNANELLQIRPLRQASGEPLVKKIEPGLSSVASDPSRASDYMSPLLDFAGSNIPADQHRTTPLYILATAGLRLLDAETQRSILDDLREDIPKNFSFRFTENGAEVISGKQEGIFQWIAINYVLGQFNHNSNGPISAVDIPDGQASSPVVFRKKTVGILDMGGASMQLAVELTTKMQVESIERKFQNSVTEINLGCEDHNFDHRYRVYVTTYLGMGANEARSKYEEKLIRSNSLNMTSGIGNSSLSDPCLPKGLVINSNVPPEIWNGTLQNSTRETLSGTGDYDSCHRGLRSLLQDLFRCPGDSCLSSHLPMNVELNDFYGFSEFWYTMEDVLRIGGPYDYYKFRKASKNFCATDWSVLGSRFDRKEYPIADRNRLKLQCFKSAWLSVALHNGLELDYHYSGLRSSPNTVKGEVVHWSLGAIILKTRFLPLREIQKGNVQSPNRTQSSTWNFHLSSISLVVCFVLVAAAIVLYLQRLRCLRKPKWTESSRPLLSLIGDAEDVERGYLMNSVGSRLEDL